MLLNRQKILLSYIYLAGSIQSKTVLTKAMFLACQEELKERSIYDFFPYKYGPYSFLMHSLDIKSLRKKDLITVKSISNQYYYEIKKKQKAKEIISGLDNKIVNGLNNIYKKYGKMKAWKIKNYVYKNYPYYAFFSEENKGIYSKHNPRLNSKLQEPKIFTIGYEGKSLDKFLNELTENNIKVLVDIRSTPESRKYGFSGRMIEKYLTRIKVKYFSIPELGVEYKYRSKIKTEKDYKKIFKIYEKKILPRQDEKISFLCELVKKYKRITLMCFEKDYRMCHRSITSKYLRSFCKEKYEILHL